MRIGIIGRGTIGGALADGLARREGISAIGATTRASAHRNAALVRDSDVVMLCVKPHDVEPVLRAVVAELHPEQVLISAAASIATAQLRDWSEDRTRIVRVMPNTPARIGAGMTVLARDRHTCEAALETAKSLFETFGRTAILDETKMDAVTAISGCGPAYAFVVMEALIDAAIALGIPYEQARELVAQTILGSAQLLLEAHAHPAVLRHEVTTPAGRTIRGTIELERGGLRATLIDAALAAAG
ncbi:MAG TPA: pyrroline-5-carboxylate reductase [Candidatus Baltobacteraceae bacterium]|nr:pyrroline-5-carboxylate reductase [Candidatus Baltobacteraceae bacterium]